MNCDYHIHSLPFSPDSKAATRLQVERAAALGIEEICLTEHLEVNFFGDKAWNMDMAAYQAHFNALAANGVRVKFGVEAGLPCKDEDFPILEQRLSAVPFDFVIASAHTVGGVSALDPPAYSGLSPETVFSEYITALLKGVKRLSPSLYSCVGHIDFPSRMFEDHPAPWLKYAHAPDELDALFRHVIYLGKCIEVNTAPYRKNGDGKIPPLDWLGRYAELGGEFVTFGSDSHAPAQTGFGLQDAARRARAAGIRYYATYDGMAPILHKLKG